MNTCLDCSKPAVIRGYCNTHYRIHMKYGTLKPVRKRNAPNRFIKHGATAELFLTNIKGIEIAKTTIDLDQLPKVIKHRWVLSMGYAFCRINGKYTMLHKYLTDHKGITDHINRDKLDNRLCNLRCVNSTQNTVNSKRAKNNTSGFKGVVWSLCKKRWRAQTKLDGKHFHIGYFKNVEDAAKAYDKKMTELHGEYAALNFPKG